MLTVFMRVFMTDLHKLHHNPREWIQPMLFFLVLLSLFGIGLGLDAHQLKSVSPAIIWIVFFITTLMSTETLFRQEQQSGLYEQYLLSSCPLWWLMLAKTCAIWMGACLPLLVLTPFVGYALQLTPIECGLLTLSIGIGSPALVFLAVMGCAMTVTLPRAGLLLCLLLLPLYIPILLLGESIILPGSTFSMSQIPLALLGGISILSITLIPHATAAALRVILND